MRFLPLLLAALLIVSCAKPNGPLQAFAGTWQCDEEASFAYWLEQSKNPEERAHMEREITIQRTLAAKLKRSLHSDIRITAHRIEGFGRILVPSYDVLRSEIKDGVIHARVLHHEDIKDPGDAEEISMRVFKVGHRLAIHLKSDGGEFAATYLFTPLP